jgi:hypothetical protein
LKFKRAGIKIEREKIHSKRKFNVTNEIRICFFYIWSKKWSRSLKKKNGKRINQRIDVEKRQARQADSEKQWPFDSNFLTAPFLFSLCHRLNVRSPHRDSLYQTRSVPPGEKKRLEDCFFRNFIVCFSSSFFFS